MARDSFETLKKVIEDNSVASEFYQAVSEWTVTAVDEHPTGDGECVCGQQELLYMYTIDNVHTRRSLQYIGSTCVQHFRSSDLNLQVTVFRGLFELRKKMSAGERVFLTPEYFSREILKWLFQEDAFPPTSYNGNDGRGDYIFLLDMFNKRNKDDITPGQGRKISGLIHFTIRPFILNHPAFGP